MNERMKEFDKLIAEGKIEEAQKLLDDEKERAKSEPAEAVLEKGKPAKFYRRGKKLENAPNEKPRPPRRN